MADTPTFQPNPYANFDPSQWTNPYSKFYGKALPWPSSYAGWPTDAMGQPIAKPPGMTLNSTPAQPAPAPSAAPQSLDNPAFQAARQLMANAGQMAIDAQSSGHGWQNSDAIAADQAQARALQYLGGLGRTAQPAVSAQPGGGAGGGGAPNMNYNTVLAMLANPGPVTTPGATVPQAASSAQPGPGVLQSFLQNWKPAQSGPGSGFTQNFNTILRGLQGG